MIRPRAEKVKFVDHFSPFMIRKFRCGSYVIIKHCPSLVEAWYQSGSNPEEVHFILCAELGVSGHQRRAQLPRETQGKAVGVGHPICRLVVGGLEGNLARRVHLPDWKAVNGSQRDLGSLNRFLVFDDIDKQSISMSRSFEKIRHLAAASLALQPCQHCGAIKNVP